MEYLDQFNDVFLLQGAKKHVLEVKAFACYYEGLDSNSVKRFLENITYPVKIIWNIYDSPKPEEDPGTLCLFYLDKQFKNCLSSFKIEGTRSYFYSFRMNETSFGRILLDIEKNFVTAGVHIPNGI